MKRSIIWIHRHLILIKVAEVNTECTFPRSLRFFLRHMTFHENIPTRDTIFSISERHCVCVLDTDWWLSSAAYMRCSTTLQYYSLSGSTGNSFSATALRGRTLPRVHVEILLKSDSAGNPGVLVWPKGMMGHDNCCVQKMWGEIRASSKNG